MQDMIHHWYGKSVVVVVRGHVMSGVLRPLTLAHTTESGGYVTLDDGSTTYEPAVILINSIDAVRLVKVQTT